MPATGAAETAPGSDRGTPALRTHKLAKTYALGFFRKKVQAIRDVSLRVERGEIFGLLGPNGAGKTTTLKVLMGLVRPTAGVAELLGRPAGDPAAKSRLGYLPESPYFYDYLSGRELLVFVAELFGLPRRESRRRADALLEQVGLTQAARLPLRRYSKGMLQRVGLAQALINDPDLVVLDEPLSGLDPIGRKQIRELIAQLGASGKTVVFSSHVLSDVELLAQRAAILVGGRTVDSGALHQLVQARVLSTEVLIDRPSRELARALAGGAYAPEAIGETVRVVIPEGDDVGALVDLVRRHHGALLAITPRRESLEDVVVKRATFPLAPSTPDARNPADDEDPSDRLQHLP
ncbi:MAG: ABC transporter ATP-binding protein [Proteobacteria bacterium]|nr:ABC transporter ATP-binding protein [Pseudomonadota bacterium]